MAYKPTLAQCLQLPLGRDAALFVVGAAADYRAQVGGAWCSGAGLKVRFPPRELPLLPGCAIAAGKLLLPPAAVAAAARRGARTTSTRTARAISPAW